MIPPSRTCVYALSQASVATVLLCLRVQFAQGHCSIPVLCTISKAEALVHGGNLLRDFKVHRWRLRFSRNLCISAFGRWTAFTFPANDPFSDFSLPWMRVAETMVRSGGALLGQQNKLSLGEFTFRFAGNVRRYARGDLLSVAREVDGSAR